MGKSLRCLEDHKDFFLSHDLSGIPQGFQVSMCILFDGKKILENDPIKPFQTEEIILPALARARQILIASSFITERRSQPPGSSRSFG